MADIYKSIYNMRLLDDMACGDTVLHRVNPLVKLLTTLVYIVAVVSFDKYETGRLLPYFIYPAVIFAMAELPVGPILKRLLLVEPLIIGIGILNPLFDHSTFVLGGHMVSGGWVTFISLMIKSVLTITAALLLIATTGMDKLALALRMLKVPKIFVLQLLLTYRYISVLMEEVARILRAYSLRAPGQKGIHRSSWGSLAGQLILRTFDRGQRVYQAMCLRGFNGEYNIGIHSGISKMDFLYLFGWSVIFILARIYDLPALLGYLLTGAL